MAMKLNFLTKIPDLVLKSSKRNFSIVRCLQSNENQSGFMDKLFGGKIEKATNAHSVLLANQQVLYELEIHHVKPEFSNEYEKTCEGNVPVLLEKNKDLMKLAGSWRSEIGALDQYVHLWRYKNYSDYSEVFTRLRKDDSSAKFKNQISKLVNRRETQVCLSFTYWGEPESRTDSHIYEMRSYSLKPGSLIEWGNNWSRGIKNRLDYRCAGMFTQIGPIYHVHHIWAYKDLASRKESREKMWNKPGWDECVAYTVPLIRKMESKIMTALPYSPTK